MNNTVEANFDGLVGPTHNYAGLAFGNIASEKHRAKPANPREAALQGLAKMRHLAELGLVQGVLAPQERPDVATLRQLGFSGSDADVIRSAAAQAPRILAACYSASSMWTANAATVSPSADTANATVHFTPANLVNKFHRAIEHEVTGRILQATFPDPRHFTHHRALPGVSAFGDEGAANHTRFCSGAYDSHGVGFFVYGASEFNQSKPRPKRYPARQTVEASQAIARSHGLNSERVVYAQQNPDVIDQGVFHNDVIAVGNADVLFCHEEAYLDQQHVYQELENALGDTLQIVEVPSARVSVSDAVQTYLFNSQLLKLPNGKTLLVLPDDCREHQGVWSYLQELVDSDSPIDTLEVFDLKQSMSNGGGPACLRLRVVLSAEEQQAVNQSTLMNDDLFLRLSTWIKRHYRDRLVIEDLADPQLMNESRTALDELTQLLALGSVYPFQR